MRIRKPKRMAGAPSRTKSQRQPAMSIHDAWERMSAETGDAITIASGIAVKKTASALVIPSLRNQNER